MKYIDYSNLFSVNNVAELLESIKINDHAINSEKAKLLFFKPIYSIIPVELETLKIYIKINFTNGFI